jgi:hypothetical protein
MVFAWDEKKNRTNSRKHGVSFKAAARIFEDPNVVSYRDRVVDEEDRWHAVGCASGIAILLASSHKRGATWRRTDPHHLGKKGKSPRARSLPRLSLTSSAGSWNGSQPTLIRRSIFPMHRSEGRGQRTLRLGVFTGQSSSW